MSEGKWNQLSSHPILFKPSYLRLLWPVMHNLILGDVGDMAWGPRIINQLWFSSPFLNLHCWRFMGVMPQGREKWRVAGQNAWVTGRGRIGSKKSHHPLPPPLPHTSPVLSSQLLSQHRNTTSTCREDGDSSLQTESTGLSPDTCLYREQWP